MTEDTVVDTTIHQPPMTGSEVDMPLFVLDRSRAQFAFKSDGLDAAGLSKLHSPSAMTLGGLLKHLALVEDRTTAESLTGQPIGALGRGRLLRRSRVGVAYVGRPAAAMMTTMEAPIPLSS